MQLVKFLFTVIFLSFVSSSIAARGCKSECINGVCHDGVCVCRYVWSGDSCENFVFSNIRGFYIFLLSFFSTLFSVILLVTILIVAHTIKSRAHYYHRIGFGLISFDCVIQIINYSVTPETKEGRGNLYAGGVLSLLHFSLIYITYSVYLVWWIELNARFKRMKKGMDKARRYTQSKFSNASSVSISNNSVSSSSRATSDGDSEDIEHSTAKITTTITTPTTTEPVKDSNSSSSSPPIEVSSSPKETTSSPIDHSTTETITEITTNEQNNEPTPTTTATATTTTTTTTTTAKVSDRLSKVVLKSHHDLSSTHGGENSSSSLVKVEGGKLNSEETVLKEKPKDNIPTSLDDSPSEKKGIFKLWQKVVPNGVSARVLRRILWTASIMVLLGNIVRLVVYEMDVPAWVGPFIYAFFSVFAWLLIMAGFDLYKRSFLRKLQLDQKHEVVENMKKVTNTTYAIVGVLLLWAILAFLQTVWQSRQLAITVYTVRALVTAISICLYIHCFGSNAANRIVVLAKARFHSLYHTVK